MSLWSEGAIPPFLLHKCYLKKIGRDLAEQYIVGLVTTIMNKPLLWAYYSAEQIVRHELSLTFKAFVSKITQESQTNSSYFAQAIMIHLAQRT